MNIRAIASDPICWVRAKLGKRAASDDETLRRMMAQWRPRGATPGKIFEFPWGEFEYLDFGHMLIQFREIFVRQHYRLGSLNSSRHIIDCGGNIGLSAIWFKRTYPDSVLTVYEADPAIAELLKRNMERAGLNEVTVRNKAVWVEKGTVRFDARGDDSGKLSPDGAVVVEAVDIVEELPEKVGLLKLDIEGAEYGVLNRLCQTGAIDRVEAVVAEFHVWRNRTDEMLATLQKLRAAGMSVCFSAEPCPWIGKAPDRSPFCSIGDYQMLMMVYAWRSPSSNAAA
jgi:FkbM family methyltransferase